MLGVLTLQAQVDLVKIGKGYLLYMLDVKQGDIPVGALLCGETNDTLKKIEAGEEGYGLQMESGYPKWKEIVAGEFDDKGTWVEPKDADESIRTKKEIQIVTAAYSLYKNDEGDLCLKDENHPGGVKLADLLAPAGEWDDTNGYLEPKDAGESVLTKNTYYIVTTAFKIYKNDNGDICFIDTQHPNGITLAEIEAGATRDVTICFGNTDDGLEKSFELQVDNDANFSSPLIDTTTLLSQSGWKYSASDIWNAFLGTGKLTGHEGKSIRYITSVVYSNQLNIGTEYYGRLRGMYAGEGSEWKLFAFLP